MPQQGGGDQTNALLRPRRTDQTLGGVAQPRDLNPDPQRVELTREMVPRHFVIGAISTIRDWAAKHFFRRRTRQAQGGDAFQREVRPFPIVTTDKVSRFAFDGDGNDRNAVGDCRRTMSGFVVSGTF